MRSRLAANAVLNVFSGASGALFALVVPVLLAHRIGALEISLWSIMMQTVIYTTPFTLGIQAVLSRRVALHAEHHDNCGMRRTMGAAFRILGLATAVYLALGLMAALLLGRLYPAVPTERLPGAQLAFVLFLAGQASMIPAAAIAGYFFGLQRNLPVAANAIGSKLIASVGVLALVDRVDLVGLAAFVSVVSIAGNLWLLAAWRRAQQSAFGVPARVSDVGWQDCLTTLRECAPISLWALATFLIYGGTSTIASMTDFAGFPAYAMAQGAALALLGFHGAAMNPLIPHMAVVHQRGGPAAVERTLTRASIVSAGISATSMLCYVSAGPPLVDALLPQRLAAATDTLLPILLMGNAIRLVGLPYACALTGLGLQGRILATPVVEAAVCVGASLWLATRHGLAGIAAAIAIGGAVSVAMHFFVNMPATRASVPVRRWRLAMLTLLVLSPAAILLYANPRSTWS